MKFDALKDFSRAEKKSRSELIYAGDTNDTLYEAFSLLKNCSDVSTDQILELLESYDLESKDGILHRLRILKALFQNTKIRERIQPKESELAADRSAMSNIESEKEKMEIDNGDDEVLSCGETTVDRLDVVDRSDLILRFEK